MMSSNTYFLPNEKATEDLARALAGVCTAFLVVFLKGELGSGKTTFVRYFLRGLNFLGSVKSPTYTLVEEYDFSWGSVYHFDLYRLIHPSELEFIGIREYFADSAILLVEWPERGQGVLKEPDIQLTFNIIQDNARQVLIEAKSSRGEALLEKMKTNAG